jgi:type IV pilus assembly protein PilO
LIIGGLAVLLPADASLVYFNARFSTPEGERRREIAAQTRRLALVRADVERAAKIREKIPEILEKFDQFENTLLPASKGYSVISQELDEYAQKTHLIVEDVQIHPKDVNGHNLTEVRMDASVTGDYVGIVNFLNDLQRSKNVYIVDSLAVDTAAHEQGAPPGALRIALHLRTYLRKA